MAAGMIEGIGGVAVAVVGAPLVTWQMGERGRGGEGGGVMLQATGLVGSRPGHRSPLPRHTALSPCLRSPPWFKGALPLG